ncbi:MAG: TonB-dependent receptor [Prevotella sp.]|nr:TonB-dependent receptor [Prevotella sp.]
MSKFKSLRKPLALLFLLCLLPLGALAQSIVKGTVKDQAGEPVIGASVKVVGTKGGAVTDVNGKFSVNANQNGQLMISYIGYITQRVNIGGRDNLLIVMQEDANRLDDVVVIGYGVQKKSDLSGAVASINGDAIKNLSTTDAGSALQGKVTGVQIINSGSPGTAAEIRVRGYSSNSGNLSPLLIVDGLKVDNIQYLDPTMIESMEILKDAASAAIYGAQAGNGVVLITTKSGAESGGKAQVSYSLKAASQSLGKKADLFNAADYIEYQKYIGNLTDEMVKANAYGGKTLDTDWYDEVFDTSWSMQHNITVQGGNQKGHFLAGLGIVDNDGIVKGNKDVYKRFTAQVNADYQIYNWLKVTSNTSVEKWEKKEVAGGYQSFLNSVCSIDPLTPAYVYSLDDMGKNMKNRWIDPDLANHGNVMTAPGYTDANPIWYGTSKYIEDATGNPLAMRDRQNGKSEGITVRGTLSADFSPVSWLTYTSRLGYRISQSNSHDYSQPWWLSTMAQSSSYSISAATNAGLYYQWENFVNFNKEFGKHSIGAMAGMSFAKTHTDNTAITSSDTKQILKGDAAPNYRYMEYLNDNGIAHLKKNGYLAPTDNTELSYFGRISYNYDGRYFLQFNIRRDAFDSSKLSDSNRWGTFPSISAGWVLSNEKFFKDAVSEDLVSFLKLRGSWGRNGNVNILRDYQYLPTISIGGYYSFGDATITGAAPNKISNPNLTWETSEQLDFGLDARFLSNRLSVGFDWYRKTTKDLLIPITPLPELGFGSATVNSGEVLNTGIDVEIGWRDHIGDLKYGVNTNFSTLKNEVQKLNSALPRMKGDGISGFNNKLAPYFEPGHEIWYFRGWKYAGVDPATGKAQYYDKDGNITGAPTEDDQQDLGSAIPSFTYGITLNLEYKGFDFTVFGTGSAGSKIYNLMVSADRSQINGINTYWKDSWRQAGDNSKYPDMKTVATDWTFFSSDAAVFSGNYFKFKQIQLGYTIPAELTKKVFINNLRVSVSLDDFFTITNYPGADPEACSSLKVTETVSARGFDNGTYPTSKKVVFGLNVTF